MPWISRLLNVLGVRRVERDLDDEQRFHIEARADDLVRGGLRPDEARREAARRFGGRLRAREASREVKLLPWLESMLRDARYGLRLLHKDAGVAAAAVLSLGLAIGACTAAFSLIDALILRPLPVRDADSLIYLAAGPGPDEDKETVLSYPLYERLRAAAPARIDVFTMSEQSLRQARLPDGGGEEEKLRVQYVSGNAMSVLGIAPARGRLIARTDDVTPGAHPVVVVSHAFWVRRLGGDPEAVGRWIRIEQRPFQIVGVAQAGFTGGETGVLTDVWIPNAMWPWPQAFTNANWGWLQVWGRLAPGVDRGAVRPILQTAYTNLQADAGRTSGRMGSREQLTSEHVLEVRSAATGASKLRQAFARPLLVLAAVIAAILLIACSNVANLLLARGAARDREMTLRASIGASRGRLLQQGLVEAALLTTLATALGVIVARLAIPVMVGMLAASNDPVHLETSIDARTLAFLAALGSLTTLLFGLAPAVRASTARPGAVLTQGSDRHTSRVMLRPLVSLQIGFSLAILFVAGLLLQSFDRLTRVDLGFSPDHVVLATIEARERLTDAASLAAGRQLLDAVRAIPGVESASLSDWALFAGWSSGGHLEIPGRRTVQTRTLGVSPDFCRTMDIRLLDGREFEPRDSTPDGPTAVIVNDAFVQKYLAGERATGRRVERKLRTWTDRLEVVGVVADVKNNTVRGTSAVPFVFLPASGPEGTLQVRTRMDPGVVAARLRDRLPRVHPSLRLTDVTLQTSLVGNAMLRERLLAVLSGFFAAVGLLLAAIGLYGVTSFAVVRRTREIGVRLALGARPSAVVRSVLGGVAIAATIGTIGGLAGGLYFARFVRALLYDTEPLDAWSLLAPIGGLLLVVLVAAWHPARRAARVDPVAALRVE